MRRPTSALTFIALAAVLAVPLAGLPASARAEWTGPCLPQSTAPTCHFWQGKVKWVDDGDTVDVKLPTSTGKRKTVRVRLTGIQAMEQSVYTRNPRKRKGDCHALPATARLEQLIQKARGTVRLAAQDPASTTGGRLRRSIAARIHGKWVDVGRVLAAQGHALWLPNGIEWAWNATYNLLTQDAAAEQRNLWNPHACGLGPSQRSTLNLTVNWDARGNDFDNVNGERVTIENLDLVTPVSLAGWWVRDSALRRYSFPSWAAIPAGGSVIVRMGIGVDTDTTFYWGQKRPVFENPRPDGRGMGDGAYLFDPQGDLRAHVIYPCLVYCDQL
jgi:endonuclease YncB( thermonuclease family)